MTHPAISIEGLGKAYRIGLKEEIPDTLVGAATSWMKSPLRNFQNLRKLNTFAANGDGVDQPDILWALRDVSFDVAEGEVLGIVGRNGAGKSTLLKIVSRITEPTHGRVTIRGRVSSLLEVGTGFHPELTGRENIYMNGTILGMRKKEIDTKFDEIVDFSGVEKFLDTPIKRYSSGMKVRLAFAVAAHLEPEILIIDEVLAVGDAEFQKKCLGKMKNVAKSGRTILFVSHNIAAVESLCDKAILLSSGTITYSGEVSDTIEEYLSGNRSVDGVGNQSIDLTSHPNRRSGSVCVLNAFALSDRERRVRYVFSCSEQVEATITFEVNGRGSDLSFAVFFCHRGSRLLMLHSNIHSRLILTNETSGRLSCVVDSLPLVPGQYDIDVAVGNGDQVLDYIEGVCSVTVQAGDSLGTGLLPSPNQGHFICPAQWCYSPL